MKKIYFLLFFFSLILASCSKEDKSVTPPEVSAVVNGRISVPGETISFASIKLDNDPKQSTSSRNGTFEFYGVPNGEHSLSIVSVLASGASITKTITFSVSFNNVDLGTIVLPKPSNITVLDSLSKAGSLTLKWNRSTDPAFKEYSLYRKGTSDVDDMSGELIFHSASAADTVFSDTYESGVTRYYRVYARTSTGALYTGNTQGVNIPPLPPLSNGNFEQTKNGRMPDGWTYNNQGVPTYSYINLSTSEVKEGQYSLELNWTDSIANYSHMANLYQKLVTSSLTPGKTYKFSFWIKSQVGKAVVSLYINDVGTDLEIPSGQDWTEMSYTFQMTSDIRDMRVEIISSEKAGPRLKAWVDDMKITALD